MKAFIVINVDGPEQSLSRIIVGVPEQRLTDTMLALELKGFSDVMAFHGEPNTDGCRLWCSATEPIKQKWEGKPMLTMLNVLMQRFRNERGVVSVDIRSRATEEIGKVWPIRYEATSLDELPWSRDSW